MARDLDPEPAAPHPDGRVVPVRWFRHGEPDARTCPAAPVFAAGGTA